MLETMPHLTHDRCAVLLETGEFAGHQSITELEICAENFAYQEHADFCEAMAERQLEAAFRSTYETDFQYLEESLRVPGPLGY